MNQRIKELKKLETELEAFLSQTPDYLLIEQFHQRLAEFKKETHQPMQETLMVLLTKLQTELEARGYEMEVSK